MPHNFGCEATDWLRGIWSSCKIFRTWSQCCLLDGASVVQILLALFSEQYTNDVLKRYVISTLCAVDRVDLVYSLKASTREKEETTPTGGSVHQITV